MFIVPNWPCHHNPKEGKRPLYSGARRLASRFSPSWSGFSSTSAVWPLRTLGLKAPLFVAVSCVRNQQPHFAHNFHNFPFTTFSSGLPLFGASHFHEILLSSFIAPPSFLLSWAWGQLLAKCPSCPQQKQVSSFLFFCCVGAQPCISLSNLVCRVIRAISSGGIANHLPASTSVWAVGKDD